jgi:hypothetical protein
MRDVIISTLANELGVDRTLLQSSIEEAGYAVNYYRPMGHVGKSFRTISEEDANLIRICYKVSRDHGMSYSTTIRAFKLVGKALADEMLVAA